MEADGASREAPDHAARSRPRPVAPGAPDGRFGGVATEGARNDTCVPSSRRRGEVGCFTSPAAPMCGQQMGEIPK